MSARKTSARRNLGSSGIAFKRSAPPDWKSQLRCSTALVPLERMLVPVVLAGGLLGSVSALANPLGGQVVGGTATISQPSTTQTVINQSSQSTVINWQSFNIPQGSQVDFNQPNNSSVALNRDLSNNASQIAGQLNANGQVWIVNPNGVAFAPTAQVNVGGLVATTSNISNSNFLAGIYKFDQPGKATASVVNQGNVSVRQAGLADLVAPSVANSGVIQAKLGKVNLASGSEYTIDMYGDGMIKFAVSDRTAAALAGARVSNTGTINAAGGTVTLSVSQAESIVDNSINAGGTVTARSVGGQTGQITVDGNGGTTIVSGTLDASGTGTGQTGGTVKVLGGQVGLTSTAKIDVSGNAGGGNVDVGGDFHGAGPDANATNTVVEQGATINASALTTGNGGQVAVWSNGYTNFDGTISARGGTQGGDGGYVETSGEGTLSVGAAALVDTGAPKGLSGEWLLDPDNITIVNGADSGADPDNQVDGSGTLSFSHDTGTDVNVDNGAIVAGLGHGNVTLQAKDDITQDTNASISSTSANSLTLQAGNNITLQAGISLGGSFSAIANDPGGTQSGTGGISVGAAISTANGGATGKGITLTVSGGTGDITLGIGSSLTTEGGTTLLSGPVILGATTAIDTTNSGAAAAGANITFDGTVNGTTAGDQALTLTAGTGGTVAFEGNLGATTALGALTLTDAALDISPNVNVTTQGGVFSQTGPTVLLGGAATSTMIDTTNAGVAAAGANITFDGTVNGTTAGDQALTVKAGGGAVAFDSTIGAANAGIGAFNVTTTGTTQLIGNVWAASLDIAGPTSLGNSLTVFTDKADAGAGADGAITFGGNIAGGANTLSLSAGSGAETLAGITSGDLTLTTTGTVTLNAGTYSIGAPPSLYAFPAVTTNGTLKLGQATSFFGAVILGSTTTFDTTVGGTVPAGAKIAFDSTINGTAAGVQAMTVTAGTGGTVEFEDNVGTTVALGAVTLSGALLDILPNVNVTTQGGAFSQTGSTILLGHVATSTTIDTTNAGVATAGANITFDGTVNGTTAGDQALTVTAGTGGVVEFEGDVGATKALGAIALTDNTTFLVPANMTFATQGGAFTQTGAMQIGAGGAGTTTIDTTNGGASAAGANITLNGTSVTGFTAGAQALTLNAGTGGTVTLEGASGLGDGLGLGAVTLTDKTLNLATPVTTQNGAFSQTGATVLSLGTTTIDTTNGGNSAGANITFDGTINGTTAGAQALTVTAGTGGVVEFEGDVGDTKALGALTLTDAALDISPDVAVTTQGGAFSQTGATVLLGGVATTTNIATNGGTSVAGANITFDGAVNGTTAGDQGLSLEAGTGGTVSLQGNLGTTKALGPLNFDDATLDISKNVNITTQGGPFTQTGATVLLGGAATSTTFDTTNGGAAGGGAGLTFESNIDGTTAGDQALTVKAGSGSVNFAGTVGASGTGMGAFNVTTTGTTQLIGNVWAASLDIAGPTSLGNSLTVFTDKADTGAGADGAITFGGNIAGGTDTLALNSGAGAITLNGVTAGGLVLTTTGLETVNAGTYDIDGGTGTVAFDSDGGVKLDGTITLDNATTFGSGTSAVSLAGATTLHGGATADTIDFAGTLDDAFALNVMGSQTAILDSAVGGIVPLASVDIAGPTDLQASVTTTGKQTYGGAVTVTGDVTLKTTISLVDFLSTVDDATNNTHSLSVAAGAGGVTFGAAVGASHPLASLDTSGTTGMNTLDGAVRTGGAQTYGGPVTLGATPIVLTTLSNGAVTFDSTVAGAGNRLTINTGGGNVTFDGGVGTSGAGIGSLSTETTGTTTLNGSIYAASLDVGGATTLGGNVSVFTDTADTAIGSDGPITFGGNIAGGADTLALNSGAGAIALNGVTAGGLTLTTTGLESVNAGTYDIDGGTGTVTFNSTGGVDLNGAIALDNPTTFGSAASAVTLTAATTLTGGSAADNITLGGTVDAATAGGESLTTATDGTVTFQGLVGKSFALSSLTTEGSSAPGAGTTDLNIAAGTIQVITTGAQTYNNAVTLTNESTLKSTGGGNITFAATVDGYFDLTTVTDGTTAFDGDVGDSMPLASITTEGSTSLASGTTELSTGGFIRTLGPQNYDNTVKLGANPILFSYFGYDITFGVSPGVGGTIDSDTNAGSPWGLGVFTGGTVTLNGAIGSSHPLSGLDLNDGTFSISGGPVDANGASIKTTGGQGYGALTLRADLTAISTAGGDIVFTSTIDGATAGTRSLTVKSDGTTTFQGLVGNGFALSSLTTEGGTILASGTTDLNIAAVGTQVITTGAQTYNNAVVLSDATKLSSTGSGNVTFGSTVNGGFALGVNTGGTTAFDGAVGGIHPLASLDTTGTGGTNTLDGNVTTGGLQSYGGPVTLGGTETLTGSTVTFDASVSGTSLTVDGNGVFDGAFPGVVTVTGAATITAPSIGFGTFGAGSLGATATTGGIAQTAGDALTVLGTSSLTDDTANQSIALTNANNALTGAVTLATSGTGAASVTDSVALGIGGTVGGMATLRAPSIDFGTFGAGSLVATATTGGIAQTAGDALTVLGASSLTDGTANQSIALTDANNALTGAVTLATSGTGGDVALTNTVDTEIVAGSHVGGALTISVGAQILRLDGSLNTGGGQTYTDATLILGGTDYTAGGSFMETGATKLGNDVSIDTSGASAPVEFNGTVDDSSAGAHSLAVNAGTGEVTFGGAIGSSFELASLTVGGPSNLNGGSISTTGNQTYQGPATIGATSTALNSSDNGTIAFGGALTDGNNLLISNGQGAITMAGNTSLERLTLNTGSIQASGPFSLAQVGAASVWNLEVGKVSSLSNATLGGQTGEAAASVIDFLPLNATLDINGFLATNETKLKLSRAELESVGLASVLGLIDDLQDQINRGSAGETAAQAAFEQRVYKTDYAVDPFALKYNILGLGASDVPGFNDISYVLDGFWENLIKKQP